MEVNIKIYRLTKGRGMDQWKWLCLSRRRGKYQFHGPHRDPRTVCLFWYCNPYH